MNIIPANLIEEYSKLTKEIFVYLEGRINTITHCSLEINLAINSNVYGVTVYPNRVNVYLLSILNRTTVRDEIISFIVLTIIHELCHTDQVYEKQFMNDNIDNIERYIDFYATSIINNTKETLEARFQFTFGLNSARYLGNNATLPANIIGINDTISHYIGIFSFIIVRNQELSDTVKQELLNPKYQNIKLEIAGYMNERDSMIIMPDKWGGCLFVVDIKTDGYFNSNVSVFDEIVFTTFSRFSKYNLSLDLYVIDDGKTLIIKMNQTKPMIDPIKIKER